jgi:hypothetical protein
MSAEGGQSDKNTLIEMVRLIYEFDKNKIGKGKTRKRNLKEILEIIKDKNKYFEKNISLEFYIYNSTKGIS